MDKIIAKGMSFKACHGVLQEEKEKPQTFKVDLELYLDLKKAGSTDKLEDTINYDEVFHVVKTIVENEQYNLIEALAENIAASILHNFPVEGAEVVVYKPQAPVEGFFDHFAIKIQRFRK